MSITRAKHSGRNAMPSIPTRNLTRLAILVLAATALAACETTGSTPTPAAQHAAKPAEPPLTRARAASSCWMSTEKGPASANIDKRADIVTKCIDDKMKAAQAPG